MRLGLKLVAHVPCRHLSEIRSSSAHPSPLKRLMVCVAVGKGHVCADIIAARLVGPCNHAVGPCNHAVWVPAIMLRGAQQPELMKGILVPSTCLSWFLSTSLSHTRCTV